MACVAMMRRSKKKRLEVKGWRFGTAQEFLGLSDEETAYVELRLRLADSLRCRRRKRNLSQTDLAKLLRSSQSRVAKMEGGDPSVSIDLLVRSLLALGASRVGISLEPSPARPCRRRAKAGQFRSQRGVSSGDVDT